MKILDVTLPYLTPFENVDKICWFMHIFNISLNIDRKIITKFKLVRYILSADQDAKMIKFTIPTRSAWRISFGDSERLSSSDMEGRPPREKAKAVYKPPMICGHLQTWKGLRLSGYDPCMRLAVRQTSGNSYSYAGPKYNPMHSFGSCRNGREVGYVIWAVYGLSVHHHPDLCPGDATPDSPPKTEL